MSDTINRREFVFDNYEDDDPRCIFSIKHGYFSHRNIGLKKTRHSLIPVKDILFAQPKVFASWLK